MYNSVAIIGGDKRQLYCANAFVNDGFKVTLGGFDMLKSTGELELSCVTEAVLKSDIVILPVPCMKNGCLNAPMAKDKIYFDKALISALKGKKIFCSQKDKLISEVKDIDENLVFDYSKREEFALQNAVCTAQGALQIAMQEYQGTIAHSKCLVCGYGRIGKILSDMLVSLNACVTVSARKASDLALISTKHLKGVYTSKIHTLSPFDIIFNTVPAMVLDSKALSHIAKNAIVIDLASIPGGVDFESASRLSICAIHALSLPGKMVPKTAGEIIKNTITNMLEEENRCQNPA